MLYISTLKNRCVMSETCTLVSNFYRPQTCSWWHQAGRSTLFLQLVSWSLFLLSHRSCTAEEARLVSQCTSGLDHKQTKKYHVIDWSDCGCNCDSALHLIDNWSGKPPGMMWPTSWTVRAEFLSSVFTLITPWLSPPMDNMALAGSGAPRTPGLQRQQKRKWRDQTGSKEILHGLHVSVFSSFTTNRKKLMKKLKLIYISLRLSAFRVSKKMSHLRIATVRASGEVAHGQITSGFRPWDWKTFRKASQDDTDPAGKQKTRVLARKARHG